MSPPHKDGDSAPQSDGAAPLIRIEHLTKRFGAVSALDGVSLDIAPRELFCLLGPSGCGKSTLLRLLAGFETPDAGRIRLDGADLAGVPPHRRPLNMMYQSYALFPHLTVAGNVGFGLRQEGMKRDALAARVAEMLALVQLSGIETRYPAQLSGGQHQRVALARALARRPRVLLLDEPLAALDRKLREDTRSELKRIQRELGATFVMVTHDQDEAMAMADRIAVMDRGRVAQIGPPAAIYERPASRFVAGFVGEASLFEGRVVAVEGGLARVSTPASPTPLIVDAGDAPLAPGEAVAITVRPERMAILGSDEPGDGRNRLDGVVEEVAYLGGVTQLRVRLASGDLVRTQQANAGGEAAPAIGASVRLGFAPAAGVILRR